MPLHLLGKKSWNVYNADNIARVKADEAAAAAREAAEEQRAQDIDAARRAAILRGETPPPLPDEASPYQNRHRPQSPERRDAHNRKKRKLAGEDDTDRDIRLATSVRDGHGHGHDREAGGAEPRVMRLRKPASDAPLTDRAGNIDLFPVDIKEQMEHQKNEDAEKEKRTKRRALEDQYTMRFSNAAGRGGLEQQPWYASTAAPDEPRDLAAAIPELASKDVWGNADPLRKQREQSRIASNDPFALMQKAQTQLKRSKEDKKRWALERERELMGLRVAQDRPLRRENHRHSKRRESDENGDRMDRRARDVEKAVSHKHRHRNRSRSRERRREPSSSRRHRDGIRNRSREEERRRHHHTSYRRREQSTGDE